MRRLLPAALLLGLAILVGGLVQWRLASTAASTGIAAFLDTHWQRPLPPQGPPPADFSALEGSLDPASCGTCHTQQHADWQQSLHSKTLSPGLLWQLRLMPQADGNSCLDCHAPLAEQKALLAKELGWQAAPTSPPPAYVPDNLAHDGLACAACHVRRHQRFGPPPRDNTSTTGTPHHGFTASSAFEDSRFCASCHQFPQDGQRTNGKLREDTLAQWQASRFAREGTTCQSCHMPDRRHLWQGIHSPDMVKQALTARLSIDNGKAVATVTNSGAGHFFPTYLVPKVQVQLLLHDGNRQQLLAEKTIGWQVDLTLEKEAFDTRLPPDASMSVEATLPQQTSPGASVELRLIVVPGEHYERSFDSVLAQRDKLDAATLALLRQAIADTRAGRYTLTLATRKLNAAP